MSFKRSWKTARWHGKTLHRYTGMFDANFYDVETQEEYWISGPQRDGQDTRYSSIKPTIDDDARDAYEALLNGAPLPGRESGRNVRSCSGAEGARILWVDSLTPSPTGGRGVRKPHTARRRLC